MNNFLFFLLLFTCFQVNGVSGQANFTTYLNDIKLELKKEWPDNKTINLVFHGHSVPSGYVNTPVVDTFGSYPYLTLKALKAKYPYAVINIIITAIGGENSESGEKRFESDVLVHKPDVLFIDYALNDMGIGKSKARAASEKIIKNALKNNIKVILMTPSTDQRVDIMKAGNDLQAFTDQITDLAKQYNIGLADSFSQFKLKAASSEGVKPYMGWVNHPNEAGNQLIADEIMKWF
nr:GDSL-type esterase/lipase family protein [Pedobacter sp. BAL39]